jgi:hypothetical protein
MFSYYIFNLYAQLVSLWGAHASWRRKSRWASAMSMLTYTAWAVLPGTRSPLSSSCGPPRPTRAVLPKTRSLLSSSGGPSCLAIAVLPGTGMPMSSSSGTPRPARALAHRDICLLEWWAPQRDTGWLYKFKNLNMKTTLKLKNKPCPGIYRNYYLYKKIISRPLFLIKSRETIPLI